MYVVTGGAGFIGSNLVAGLEESAAGDIVVCDRRGTDDKWRNIAKRDLVDIIPPEHLESYIKSNATRVDALLHMGAISSTTELNADLIIEQNFRLSCSLWNICKTEKIPFIYASSAATYGAGENGFLDNASRLELSKLRPLNAYGWSKHLFDRWIARKTENWISEGYDSQWVGLKFFNVYGPNEYHKNNMISVALKNFKEIKAGGPAVLFKSHNPLYSDGGQMRDFIWVGDCIKVMLWLLKNPQISGLFNLGTGRAQSFDELVNAVYLAMGKTPQIQYVETPIEIREKYQYFTQADIGKLRAHGYKSEFKTVEEGVREYVQSFLRSDDPYK